MEPQKMLDFIKSRRSPRAFSDKTISDADLAMIFEAARWAPSSYNSQPWRFICARQGSPIYQTIASSMVEWNQQWAKSAPVLAVTLVTKNYEHNNTPYFHAHHDLGMAVGQLSLQALSQNIYLHHIGGFDSKILTKNLNISDKYEVVTVFAMGYIGSDDRIPKEIADVTNKTERTRKPLSDILFVDKIPE